MIKRILNGLMKLKKLEKESQSRDIINADTKKLYGAQVISDIWKETNGDAIVVSDVGQHQMLEAQYYKHDEPNTLAAFQADLERWDLACLLQSEQFL